MDTDGNGVGNNADIDDDGDGVLDIADAFPLDSSESVDTDTDGTGDNADLDDDGDGWDDSLEILAGTDPTSSSSFPKDTNKNGIPDSLELEGKSEDKIPVWAYLLLVATIVLSLLLLLLLMRRRKEKPLDFPAVQPQQNIPAGVPPVQITPPSQGGYAPALGLGPPQSNMVAAPSLITPIQAEQTEGMVLEKAVPTGQERQGDNQQTRKPPPPKRS